jgi:hypothetical protein
LDWEDSTVTDDLLAETGILLTIEDDAVLDPVPDGVFVDVFLLDDSTVEPVGVGDATFPGVRPPRVTFGAKRGVLGTEVLVADDPLL